jgi:hypothetical protein
MFLAQAGETPNKSSCQNQSPVFTVALHVSFINYKTEQVYLEITQ